MHTEKKSLNYAYILMDSTLTVANQEKDIAVDSSVKPSVQCAAVKSEQWVGLY